MVEYSCVSFSFSLYKEIVALNEEKIGPRSSRAEITGNQNGYLKGAQSFPIPLYTKLTRRTQEISQKDQ
jgi:hypothetical protein